MQSKATNPLVVLPTGTLVRRGIDLIATLKGMVEETGGLSLRTDLAEYLTYILQALESHSKTNPTSPAGTLLLQLCDRIALIQQLRVYPPTTPILNRFCVEHFANISQLTLHQCPLTTILDLYELRQSLVSLIVTFTGIVDLAAVLIPSAPRRLKRTLPPLVLPEQAIEIPSKYCWLNILSLTLTNCGLTRMDCAFHFFPALSTLDLSHNDITHISHLQDCICLESLDISYNRVRVLSNISHVIGRLRRLNLAHNEIESLDGLDKLYALESVNLAGNYVSDVSEVRQVTGLPCLEGLTLANNPLVRRYEEQDSSLPSAKRPLSSYRLAVYREFLSGGQMLSGQRAFPSLDRRPVGKRELAILRKEMFRAPVESMRESSYGPGALADMLGAMSPDDDNEAEDMLYYDGSFDNDNNMMGTIVEEEEGDDDDNDDEDAANAIKKERPKLTRGDRSLSPPPSSLNLRRASLTAVNSNNNKSSGNSNRMSMSRTMSTSRSSRLSLSAMSSSSSSSSSSSFSSFNHGSRSSAMLHDLTHVAAAANNGDGHSNSGSLMALLLASSAPINSGSGGRRKRKAVILTGNEPELFVKLSEVTAAISAERQQAMLLLEEQRLAEEKERQERRESRERTDGRVDSRGSKDSPSPSQSRSQSLSVNSNRHSSSSPKNSSIISPIASLAMHNISRDRDMNNRDRERDRDRDSREGNESDSHTVSRTVDNMIEAETRPTPFRFPSLAPAPPFSSNVSNGSNGMAKRKDGIAADMEQEVDKETAAAEEDEEIGRDTEPWPHANSLLAHHNDDSEDDSFSLTLPPSALKTNTGVIRGYVGEAAYANLNVRDNLELYLREQVWGNSRPDSGRGLYLEMMTKSGGEMDDPLAKGYAGHDGEKLITIFIENLVPVPLSSTATTTSSNSNEDNDEENSNSKDQLYLLALTDRRLYLLPMAQLRVMEAAVIMTDTASRGVRRGQLDFEAAPRLMVTAHYPLHMLSGCTIYFGFQRCSLTFSRHVPLSPSDRSNSPGRTHSPPRSAAAIANSTATSTSTGCYAVTAIARWMVVTRDKTRCYSLITRLPQAANAIRNSMQPEALPNARIENKDGQLVEAALTILHGLNDKHHDIVHYQLLFQLQRKEKRLYARSLLATQSRLLLCQEALRQVDVKVALLETVRLKDVTKISLEENDLGQGEGQVMVELQFRRAGGLLAMGMSTKGKWRLLAEGGRAAAMRLLDELRRLVNEQVVD